MKSPLKWLLDLPRLDDPPSRTSVDEISAEEFDAEAQMEADLRQRTHRRLDIVEAEMPYIGRETNL